MNTPEYCSHCGSRTDVEGRGIRERVEALEEFVKESAMPAYPGFITRLVQRIDVLERDFAALELRVDSQNQ